MEDHAFGISTNTFSESAVFVFMADVSSATLLSVYPTTHCHIPKHADMNKYHSEKLISYYLFACIHLNHWLGIQGLLRDMI